MAKIQRYRPQVGAPGGSTNVQAPLEDPYSAAMVKSGAALAGAGRELYARELRLQEEKDQLAVLSTMNQIADEEREYTTSVLRRQGRNASGVTDEAKEYFADLQSRYSATLKTDRQRQLFAQEMMSVRDRSLDMYARHEATQHQVYKNEVLQGRLTSFRLDAGTYFGDFARIDGMMAQARNLVSNLRSGHDNTALIAEFQDKMVASAIDGALAAEQYGVAQEIWHRYGGKVSAGAREQLSRVIDGASSDERVVRTVNQILGTNTLDEAAEKTRGVGWGEKYNLDLAEESKVRAAIGGMASHRKAQSEANLKAAKNNELMTIYKLTAAKDYAGAAKFLVSGTPALQTSDPATWNRLRDQIERGQTTTDPVAWANVLMQTKQGNLAEVSDAMDMGLRADKVPQFLEEVEAFKKSGNYGRSAFDNAVALLVSKASTKEEAEIKAQAPIVLRHLMRQEGITSDYDAKIAPLAEAYWQSRKDMEPEFWSKTEAFLTGRKASGGPDWYALAVAGDAIYTGLSPLVPNATPEDMKGARNLLSRKKLEPTRQNLERAVEAVKTGKKFEDIPIGKGSVGPVASREIEPRRIIPQMNMESNRKLATVDTRIQDLLAEVAKRWKGQLKVTEGWRGPIAQNSAKYRGASNAGWGESAHNTWPSKAVDVYPVVKGGGPYDNTDTEYQRFGALVKQVADEMGLKVRWGGDFKGKMKGDYGHVEIIDVDEQLEKFTLEQIDEAAEFLLSNGKKTNETNIRKYLDMVYGPNNIQAGDPARQETRGD